MSFSIQIIKCNVGDCKPDKDVKDILEQLLFNYYYLKEQLDFSNYKNLFNKPTIFSVQQLMQFKLEFNGHRDNNNFFRRNDIETYDSRYNGFYTNNYQFYDLVSNMPWQEQRKSVIK